MRFVKGMIVGVTVGAIIGVAIGATNCDCIYNAVKSGKKELKRFKRKYCY